MLERIFELGVTRRRGGYRTGLCESM